MQGRQGEMGCNNPCLTMHQPWASLLVYGIKRIEGRSWPAPLTGRLWIHAAGKVPDPATIKAMENYYREIYAIHGIMDVKFPEHYPVSQLLGCVEVVGCVKCEELVCWEEVPEVVRLEGLTKFCWLCEKPQKLLVPLKMGGNQGVYNLERKIYEAAIRGLCRVEGPQPVKFPLPDPRDPFSLKPGSLVARVTGSEISKVEKSPSLTAAIAGARAAATQYSKKDVQHQANAVHERRTFDSSRRHNLDNKFTEGDRKPTLTWQSRPQERNLMHSYNYKGQITHVRSQGNTSSTHNQVPHWDLNQRLRGPSNKYTEEDRKPTTTSQPRPQERDSAHSYREQNVHVEFEGHTPSQYINQRLRPESKIFAAAVAGLMPALNNVSVEQEQERKQRMERQRT